MVKALPYFGVPRERADTRALKAARVASLTLTAMIASGTLLLASPYASANRTPTPVVDAFFTTVSAASLTGLVVVDTDTHFSMLGKVTILALIQFSGLGVMSLASLLALLLTQRANLNSRRVADAEGRNLTSAKVRSTLLATVALTLISEAIVALAVATRLVVAYDYPPSKALWHGIFHAISAFNNAGFALYADSLISFNGDWFILIPISGAIVVGGLGFPMLKEIVQRLRRPSTRPWSVTTQVTATCTGALLTAGAAGIALTERRHTFADMPTDERILNALFSSVTPRTAGFNSIDYGEASPLTLMLTDALMFIGGGSAGTAGGIKVTTVAILLAAVAAEFRGRAQTSVGKRLIPPDAVRQALTVLIAGAVTVVIANGAIRMLEPELNGDAVLFEVISAFGTVGLSTGITAELSHPSLLILSAVMFLGRLGPFTLATALAFRRVQRRFSYPEERPLIG